MRTEKEMMQLILDTAMEDERIRAVGMNGSRTNPNVSPDIFQDYDIVYIVKDVQSFIDDPGWIDVFGERLIMQTPDAMSLIPSESKDTFAYLMKFHDGNRIDLTLFPVERAAEWHGGDKLSIVLLDKDNILPTLDPPTDKDYQVQRPNQQLFDDCCNEFWWVSTYVVKGLWRQELIYAQDHLHVIRGMLMHMLSWRIGMEHDFAISVGKSGKHFKSLLDKQEWEALLETYADGSYQGAWQALDSMCQLFEQTALKVARQLELIYDTEESARVQQYHAHIRQLPLEAKAIY
ncbi:aminoglycoside 6-adenylyltransferase [Gracilibacillus alcaliphilus]|uniref:aminoglycoside 6-adenylyltransferase n=1 Tax=Gracilibacillus alcaliphilus TaxID=1401441 RepID=UPI00195C7CF4|nr:aminoglycoside 6-adenylyltransferase [Gracilibacillus alcaliphilus]MBM7676505.1 aminoglycoside 6-adenylyltransferase [Gracilibacillus alcaliphilus]